MAEDKNIIPQNHPVLIEGINNMIRRGFDKEEVVRVTGALPETVDKHWQRHLKGNLQKTEPREENQDTGSYSVVSHVVPSPAKKRKGWPKGKKRGKRIQTAE